MLGEGRLYMLNSWWIATFPGLAIFLTTLVINLMGSALRALLDPRMEEEGAVMAAQPHVYVIQGRTQQDYADCQAALAGVPARMTMLPFLATEDEVIAKTRDADAIVVVYSPIT